MRPPDPTRLSFPLSLVGVGGNMRHTQPPNASSAESLLLCRGDTTV